MQRFFTQSISRLVMASFVFVLLLPLGFIISYLNYYSWTSAENELKEKHYLIAKGLENPINQYVKSYEHSLNVFLEVSNFANQNEAQFKSLLDNYVNATENLSSVSYLSTANGRTFISPKNKYKLKGSEHIQPFNYHLSEYKYRKYAKDNTVSNVIRSDISRKPVIIMSHHIMSSDQNKIGTVFLELELDPIAAMCRKIRFGDKGHCAIFDKTGQVIAHPKANLEAEIHNLSKIGLINKQRESRSGIWSFYSPIAEEDMVAGYSTVEGLGWGILIPQPEKELESPFKSIIHTVITWLVVGIVISLLVAYILAHQITKPLYLLLRKSKEIGIRADTYNLGAIPKNSPNEITTLWNALSALVDRLHASNKQVRKLNYSLSKDVEKATAKLRATNLHLYKMSSQDHLTQIANRRYFEDSVHKIFKKKADENLGIIVIDVDKFKHINDHYGHEAGDLALKHIAQIMKDGTRGKDIPARLGGDEFVAYIHNCEDKVLVQVAENLRRKVQNSPIEWEGEEIQLSLSVGTVNCHTQDDYTLDQLLKFADEAMYESKQAGRNSVSSYSFKEVDPYQEKLEKLEKLKRKVEQKRLQALKAKEVNTKKTVETPVFQDTLDIDLMFDESNKD